MLARTIALVALMAIGCAGDPPPLLNKTDSKQAQSSLEFALKAWQKGEPISVLSQATPPIFMNDEDWSRGRKLTRFELSEPQPYGIGMKFRAVLTLEGPGKSGARTIQYRVYTDPQISIARDDS